MALVSSSQAVALAYGMAKGLAVDLKPVRVNVVVPVAVATLPWRGFGMPAGAAGWLDEGYRGEALDW